MLKLMFDEIQKMLVVVAGGRVLLVQFYRTAEVKTFWSECRYYRNVAVTIESHACAVSVVEVLVCICM